MRLQIVLYLHSSELILSHLQIQTTLTILRYFGTSFRKNSDSKWIKTWSEHDPTHNYSNFLQYTTGSDDFDTKDSLLPSSSSGDDPNTNTSARIIAQFYGLLTSSIEGNIKTFCMQIPNVFSERISTEDLDLLFQNSCLELFMLRVAYR